MGAGTRPRVSVLVSTYDRPRFLSLALRSILAQSYSDFDVLVWNDGGIPMEGVVPELGDPRVRYHHHPENLGVMQAVANGMRAISGEYIAHIDDDDEWEPEYLGTLVGLLETAPSAVIAFCDHWVTDETGEIDLQRSEHNSRHWGRSELEAGVHEPAYTIAFDGTIPIASAALLRRSALDLEDVPPELGYAWDLWIAYLATRGGGGVLYEPQRMVRKCRHAGQLMSPVAKTQNLTDLATIYERMWAEPAFAVDRATLSRRYARATANWALALLRDDEVKAARRAARRSLSVRYSLRGAAASAAAALPGSISRFLAAATSAGVARRRGVAKASHLGHGSHRS